MTNRTTTRRDFLQTSAAGVAAGMLGHSFPGSAVAGEKSGGRYANLESEKYLGEVSIAATVQAPKIFTEGPAVDRDGHVFFTNVSANEILKFDPHKKTLSSFRKKSNAANGLLFDPLGNLLVCEGGAGRVTKTNMQTGEVKVLASKYNGFRLAAPNDLALDKLGHIYFTSRPGVEDPAKGNVNAVYRIDPDGKLTQLLALPKVHMPNGIVTSPDDSKLYLIEADGGKNRNRNIKVFDLDKDGNLSNEKVHHNFSPGRSGDGMCIDEQGNLYVAAGLHKTRGSSETLDTKPGIHVISPEGKLLAYRKTPIDTVTNCAFGGANLKTLYVTCGKYLLSIPTEISGKADYRPGLIS